MATIVWQEPLSALYAKRQQDRLGDELRDGDGFDLRLSERRALSQLRSARRRMSFLARRMRGHAQDGMALGRIRIPQIGASDAPFNVVPVDFVIDALAAGAQDPDAVGATLHLVDPDPVTAHDVTDLFAELYAGRTRGRSLPVISRICASSEGSARPPPPSGTIRLTQRSSSRASGAGRFHRGSDSPIGAGHRSRLNRREAQGLADSPAARRK